MSQSEVETAFSGSRDAASTDNTKVKSGPLLAAGIAGVFASACCIGPLVLASIGLGSITSGVVALFEPLRPIFIVIALAALAVAGWKIYRRPAQVCEPGTACVEPQTGNTTRIYKAAFWVVAGIVVALLTFPYYVSLLY